MSAAEARSVALRLLLALTVTFGVFAQVAATTNRATSAHSYDAHASYASMHDIALRTALGGTSSDHANPVALHGVEGIADSLVIATEAGSIRNVNPLGGTANCVNCAVATDATLSGAPSSALNVRPGVAGQPISVLEDIYGGAFKPVGGQAQIEQTLIDAGSGSRGIVFGSRGADAPGHVFNAVNQNGAIRFLDGQTGGVASFKGYTGFEFLVTG